MRVILFFIILTFFTGCIERLPVIGNPTCDGCSMKEQKRKMKEQKKKERQRQKEMKKRK